MADPFDEDPPPLDLDSRIRQIKRRLGSLGTELGEARRLAPKGWTGKCARAARSFGAYDRGRTNISRRRDQIHKLNTELQHLRTQARKRHALQLEKPQPLPSINVDRYSHECPAGESQMVIYYGARDNEMPAGGVSRVRLHSEQLGSAIADIIDRQPGVLRLQILD